MCPLIPSLLELPPVCFVFCFFFATAGVARGGIDSDSPHTLRASDSAQLWCSSNSAQNTVGALPQLPRSSQTRSDVLGSALNDTKFISKLDTHTESKTPQQPTGLRQVLGCVEAKLNVQYH